jgi:hypothetical protein
MAWSAPRVAIGVALSTPKASLRQRLSWRASLAGPYADDLDFWPSAYQHAVDVLRNSCSVCELNDLDFSGLPCTYVASSNIRAACRIAGAIFTRSPRRFSWSLPVQISDHCHVSLTMSEEIRPTQRDACNMRFSRKERPSYERVDRYSLEGSWTGC